MSISIDPGSIIELDGTIVSPSGVRTTLPEGVTILPNGGILSSNGSSLVEPGILNIGPFANNIRLYGEAYTVASTLLTSLSTTNTNITPDMILIISRIVSESYVYGQNSDTSNSINMIINYLNIAIDQNDTSNVSTIALSQISHIITNTQDMISRGETVYYDRLNSGASHYLDINLSTNHNFLKDILCFIPSFSFIGNETITVNIAVSSLVNALVNLLTNTEGLSKLITINVTIPPIGVSNTLWESVGGTMPNTGPSFISPTTTLSEYYSSLMQTAKSAINNYKNDTNLPWSNNISDALVNSVSLLVAQLYESAVNNQDYLNVLASFFNIVIDLSGTQMYTSSNIRDSLDIDNLNNYDNAYLSIVNSGMMNIPIQSFKYMLATIPLVWVIGDSAIGQKYIIESTAKYIIKYLANYKYTVNMIRELTLFTNGLPGQTVNGFNNMLWGSLVKLSQVTTNDNFDIDSNMDYINNMLGFPGIYFNPYELVANYLGPVPVSSTVVIPKHFIPSITAVLNDDESISIPKDYIQGIQYTVPSRIKAYGSVVQADGTLKDISNNIIITDPLNSNEPYIIENMFSDTFPLGPQPGSVVLDDGSIWRIGRASNLIEQSGGKNTKTKKIRKKKVRKTIKITM
jgi:hypothetical protein